MSFLHPYNIAWLLLAIPIAAFYLWRRREVVRQVAALWFWQEALARRSAWVAYRRTVSLLVQLAVLGLLVAALTSPLLTRLLANGRAIVLVVDTSASMRAVEDGTTRLQSVLSDCREMIDRLGQFDQVAILSAGSAARVHCGLTGDRELLNAALAAITPSDGGDHLVDAVGIARELLKNEHNPMVVMATDGAFDGVTALAQEGDIRWLLAESNAGNLALTRFEARRGVDDSERIEVLTEVANFSGETVDTEIVLELNGDTRSSDVHLEPGAHQRRIVGFTNVSGGLLAAKLTHADALESDNTATTLVVPRRGLRVAIATDASPSLRAALALMENVEINSSSGDVTVLAGELSESLPADPLLVIAPTSSCDTWKLIEYTEGPFRLASPREPALLGDVDLDGVVIDALARLEFTAPANTIVATAEGLPVISIVSRPGGPVVVVHVDWDTSDLTTDAAFPALIATAVRWLGGWSGFRSSFTTDDIAQIDTSGKQLLRSPSGDEIPHTSNSPLFALLDQAGGWSIEGDGPSVIASNILNAEESDLRPRIEATTFAIDMPGPSMPIWQMLIGIAVALLIVEWMLFHRRVTE